MKKKLSKVEIYTDGACRGNPGPGGWGAVLIYNEVQKEIKGFNAQTTNNIMELEAVINSLKALKKPCSITITTDSNYVKLGITDWIKSWEKNNWKTANKKPVKNKVQWQQLRELSLKHEIVWKWVKGHSGHPQNERADQLANDAIDESLQM